MGWAPGAKEGSRVFRDRSDAGRLLASRLAVQSELGAVVLGMPRGGVPVAAEVASLLGVPLDIIVVRKIGCPWQPELGIGALAEGDVRVLNQALVDELGVRPDAIESATARERVELERRLRCYRGDRAPIPVEGRVAILVDDGLATGYTARAAIEALRRRGAGRVILAVPVAPPDSRTALAGVADEVVVLETPPWLFAIGEFYQDFSPTTDEEVIWLLTRHGEASHGAGQVAGSRVGRVPGRTP
jgi:putative phosphoribosyl transferase